MKVPRPNVGQPTLKPADLGNPQAAVLTIAKVDFRQSNFASERSGEKETKTVLEFAEAEGKELWIGKRGTSALIDHYGDESDKWLGKPVPLIRATVSVGGRQSTVMQIAAGDPPLDWDGVLNEGKKRSKKDSK
jgi:hypothetical protein